MTVNLTPEDEKLIQELLESGAFRTPEEVIHDALAARFAEMDWMLEDRDAIDAKIARGLEQLDRGEGIPGDELAAHLEKYKAEWLRKKNGG